jgi:IS605 OrfB family transposase
MASRYRIYPTTEQAEVFTRHASDTRCVWNLALEQFNLYDRRVAGRSAPSFAEVSRQLKDLRAGSFLADGSSSVQKEALRDFQQSAKNWWRGSHHRPTWRKRGQHEGFCIRDVRVKKLSKKWASVHVPKCGYVRFRLSRELPDDHGMGRVTKDPSGRWHVAFSAPQPQVVREPSGQTIGIDLGIARSVTASDGKVFNAPVPTKDESKRRLRLERKLARQVKGSNRREATKAKLARLHARQSDRLKDWREKVSTELVRTYDVIVLEDLRVANLLRSAKGTVEAPGKNVAAKSGLNRSISAQGWSALSLRIEQKAKVSGVTCSKVSPINTSRKCGVCGHTTAENRKSQAVFSCSKCGHVDHADTNAAKNILAAGLAVIGRGGNVRPLAPFVASGRPAETSTPKAAVCVA